MSRLYSFKDSFLYYIRIVKRRFSVRHGVFISAIIICVLGIVVLVWQINAHFLITIPVRGGTMTEAIIGSPRFINPVLAFSNADKDLTSLIYSGLMKTSADGTLVPNLAKSYSISDNGRTYTFTLKNNIYFQDGTPITTQDVAFTVAKAQDSLIRSPKQANWDGVQVNVVDNTHIQFILPQPYAPFLENTTLGILPAHIWKNISPSQFNYSLFNIRPVGSGPYQINQIERDSSGLPVSYTLTAFNNYALGEPYIKTVVIKLFDNRTNLTHALKQHSIDAAYDINTTTVSNLSKDYQVNTSPLPRVFGVFFNTDIQPLFLHKEVREALNDVVDRTAIVNNVFDGYAVAVSGPLPPSLMKPDAPTHDIQKAQYILTKAGWNKNPDTGIWELKTKNGTESLSFTLSTSTAPELSNTAKILKQEWEAFGAHVTLSILSVGDINQKIIRPREYQALLFGTSVGRQGDLYSFWHSSQRNDPGLNIALYTNIDADKDLENLRKTTDPSQRTILYRKITTIINNDVPAIFLYSPDFTYLTDSRLHNVHIGILNSPSERFADIATWYVETEKVWKAFAHN